VGQNVKMTKTDWEMLVLVGFAIPLRQTEDAFLYLKF
jgi:hypothetical protein